MKVGKEEDRQGPQGQHRETGNQKNSWEISKHRNSVFRGSKEGERQTRRISWVWCCLQDNSRTSF